jgi:hypothetical protein
VSKNKTRNKTSDPNKELQMGAGFVITTPNKTNCQNRRNIKKRDDAALLYPAPDGQAAPPETI